MYLCQFEFDRETQRYLWSTVVYYVERISFLFKFISLFFLWTWNNLLSLAFITLFGQDFGGVQVNSLRYAQISEENI